MYVYIVYSPRMESRVGSCAGRMRHAVQWHRISLLLRTMIESNRACLFVLHHGDGPGARVSSESEGGRV